MKSQINFKNIRAVFTDLDDTLTENSKISPETYRCLWTLKEKGIWVVIVSGRPAGWADCLMRLWPIDAMIFENGAGMMIRKKEKHQIIYVAKEKDRLRQMKMIHQIWLKLKREFPHIKLASDQFCRLFDRAIDYREESPHLSQKEVKRVMEMLSKNRHITAKLSSIHINFWCGNHTKVSACQKLIQGEGKKRNIDQSQILFIGDSPNDEPLFSYFRHTVGVRNITPFLDGMKFRPLHVTRNGGGKGFEEAVGSLIKSIH